MVIFTFLLSPFRKFHFNAGQIKTKKVLNKPTIRENAEEFCKATTFHGLKFVGDNRISWFERIFFVISFVTVFLVASYFIYDIFKKWGTTPIIVSISSTPIYINAIPFAGITICNMNQAIASKVQNVKENSPEHGILKLLCNRRKNLNLKLITNSTNPRFIEDFIFNVSQPCDQLLLSCKFASLKVNCSEIFQTILTDEGVCCTFNALHKQFMYSSSNDSSNSKTNLKNLQDGAEPVNWSAEKGYSKNLPKKFYPRLGANVGVANGLSLILNTQVSDYYCSSTNSPGIKFSLHNPVEKPNVKEIGLVVPVGTENRIRIMPEIIEASDTIRSIAIKNRKCIFDSEDKLQYFRVYTQKNCEKECDAEVSLEKCNCVPFHLAAIKPKAPVCNIHNMKCLEDVRKYMRHKKNSNGCHANCYQSCFDLLFTVSVFPTAINASSIFEIKDKIVENMTAEYAAKNIIGLNFFYRENGVRGQLKNEFIGPTEFLSYTGGLMGLFLGFSFISIVEILYYLSLRPYFATRRYNRFIKEHSTNQKKCWIDVKPTAPWNVEKLPNFYFTK